jgi:hypothetical protein
VRGPKKPTEPPMSPGAVALVQGYQTLGYVQPSATDGIKAEEFVAELAYLTVPGMLERMRQHLTWCEQNGKPKPVTLGGFWNTLRAENDFLRDKGAGAGGARGQSSGFTRAGDALGGVL